MSATPQITSQIECRNLGVGVAKGPRLATVDVQIAAGRFTAILGPNGAGKSTLMSMLVGERAPQCGQVLLDGHPLASHGMDRWRSAGPSCPRTAVWPLISRRRKWWSWVAIRTASNPAMRR